MYLYHLTLQRPTAINVCIHGNFSNPKIQEIVVCRGGRILELLRPDDNGRLQTIVSTEVFGLIRSLTPFRLTGGTKDYVVVGSDSGRIAILEYNDTKNCFEKVHMETFGKSGCRRIVPGEYLAVDPRGRAVMIAAVEKQKLVYVLNRDSKARLTISSPLEAHKSHTICFSVCGVDVGFENPIFAAIEFDYTDYHSTESSERNKVLTFYELDLGLNHVSRKWSETVDRTSNLVISVPYKEGPGGVLLCAENYIYFKNQGHPDIKVSIPRRKDMPIDEPILIVSYATHKQKDLFFFLLQSEFGDLYKVKLVYTGAVVSEIDMQYFDTVPVASSMVILRSGFLFVAAEFGNHAFYQFQEAPSEEQDLLWEAEHGGEKWTLFQPRILKNLLLLDELPSLAPMMDFKVLDLLHEDTPQIYTICGRGPRAAVRVLRHGLPVTEMAVSGLPSIPTAVWTLKKNARDPFDKYIVVSLVSSTLVLAVGDTVDEVTDSGFLGSTTTLNVSLIGEDSLVQIHPNGIRLIRADRRISEWQPPNKRHITHAAVNQQQVVICLSGGTGSLFYFELDNQGQLNDVERHEMGREIACIDIAPVTRGQRARFMAVGDFENNVRILSLLPESYLQQVSLLSTPTQPESVCLIEMTIGKVDENPTMFLNVGLRNGLLLRSVVDAVSGELSDNRTRCLGSRPVKLFKIKALGKDTLLALSSRSWICYNYQSKFHMTPLSYVPLEYSAPFSSQQCAESIVSVSGTTLRIITIDRFGDIFNQQEQTLLRYTPHKFITLPNTNLFVILETDHAAYNERGKQLLKEDRMIAEDTKEIKEPELPENVIGAPRAPPGQWASCIRLFDPLENKTLQIIELSDNEAAFSVCTCTFHDHPSDEFLVVGTAKDLVLQPRSCTAGFIHVYKILDGGRRFELLHKTRVEEVPLAVRGFQDRLLVGLGPVLRIYDLGKKKLLRKCENKNFPNFITQIHTNVDRIIVGDITESFLYVKYKRSDNRLYIFADDTVPRWITCGVMVDYDTMIGADKFGSLFVIRLPSEVSDEIEEDPTGSSLLFDKGYLNGAPHKVQQLIHFYTGDTICSITNCELVPGVSCVIYSTVMGAIGALVPFPSREDVDFFQHLEMHMCVENPPLCGRDHTSFRSAYFPVKDVIDGDLCEQFGSLEPLKQRAIAEELDRSPADVLKRLEDIRHTRLL